MHGSTKHRPRFGYKAAWVAACLVGLGLAAVGIVKLTDGQGGPAEPRLLLYLRAPAVRAVLAEENELLGARARSSTYRQGPDHEQTLPPTRLLGKIDATDVVGLSPERLAAKIERAVENGGCEPKECAAHIVAFDDVGLEHRGKRGVALSSAMRRLDKASPFGGSFAERTLLYLDVEAFLDLSRPGGADRWAKVGPALARAGGVWIETYRSVGVGQVTSLSRQQWIAGAETVARVVRAAGGTTRRLHFLFGPDPPRAALSNATATSLNLRILCNGVGAYNMTPAQAREWLDGLRATRNRCGVAGSAAT